MDFKIAVIGLGLMGGSLCYALKGFRNAEIYGCDADRSVCEAAVKNGAVKEAGTECKNAVENADLIIFSVYAHHIPDMIKWCAGSFIKGAVITDICGVKSELYRNIAPIIPADTDYVGVHPMAGKERAGFINADPAIFKGTGFLICPLERTRPESIALMRELAAFIGADKTAVVPYKKHDEIIAYTSDLMHIAASALCVNYHPDMTSAYTAGAYRDCTRIADIDADAWRELLLSNRVNTSRYLGGYIKTLCEIQTALDENDGDALQKILLRAGINKREMKTR